MLVDFDQTLTVGGESYNVQVTTVQPRKQMCYAPDLDKENSVQQLGWIDKRLAVQTSLSHSVKERMKQQWSEQEQSKFSVCSAGANWLVLTEEKNAQNTAKFIDSRADLRKERKYWNYYFWK